MEFGVQARGPYEEMAEIARWAEGRGLAAFALPDHYLVSPQDASTPAYDNLAIVAGLARETSTIRLAILVSPITFRHPAVLAKNAVTLDAMSGGRFTLGVGTGWLVQEHEIFGLPYPDAAERWERMEEALGYLRAVFASGAVGFEGEHYELQAVDIGPTPSAGLKIVVGGMGKQRTPTLAGRFADEYNGYPEQRSEMQRRIEVARGAAVDNGRDPDGLLISSSGFLVMGETDAEYRRNLERTAEILKRTTDQLEESFERRSTPRGTVEQVRHLLGTMADAGVERFYVQSLAEPSVAALEETLGAVGAFD